MALSIAGIIAAVGILFGLNFIGLFIAAYVFDKKARHVLWYLAAAAALMANGVFYLLSIVAPYTALSLVFVEVCQGLGFIALAYGFAGAFHLRLSHRFLWGLFVVGTLTAFALMGLSEIDVARLVTVSLWHAMVMVYLAVTLLRAPGAGFQHRFLACLALGPAVAALLRPVVAAWIQLDTTMSFAEQVEAYGAVVNIAYLTALFGIGAGVFFHVMSDLASGYRQASLTDALTGMLNRRGFLDAAKDGAVTPSALIMIDIDRFKSVNDTYGHHAGDRVIVAVADILGRHVGPPHVAGRLGGEEFAIVLRRVNLATARALAHSLRAAIEVELDGLIDAGLSTTASFGVAMIGEGGMEGALVDADRALYRAKRQGRNAVCVADGYGPPRASRSGGRRSA